MRVRDLLRQEKSIGPTDLAAIIALVLGTSKEGVYREPERQLDDREVKRITAHVAERRDGRPLSYITRIKEFFSEEFFVDERVLVPRPETEVLVEETLRLMAATPRPRVLDMGTGSGAIGITLARHGAAHVTCVDISADALDVARSNAKRLAVEHHLSFIRCDLFSGIRRDARFDFVVANLPYISAADCEKLMPDVRYEPAGALRGGTAGTELYERFVAEIPEHLERGGALLCELGGTEQIEEIGRVLKELDFQVTSRKDLSGQDRVLIASWKNLS